MRLAFIDLAYDYTVDRPEALEALGGTTSAVCFLARALKIAGHDITIFNKVRQPAVAHGISSLPLERLAEARYDASFDAFIFCGRWTEWLVQHVAEATTAPLIAWMHESRFAPPLTPAMPHFSGVVCVSDWQAVVTQSALLPQQKQCVIRNAMNPAVEVLFPPDAAVLAGKQPVAVYIGSTPRGLLHLPAIWPQLQAAQPGLRLRIFSNPAISADAAQNAALADHLRAMPGVEHLGMIGQPELAQQLRQASFFLAPNPYPETSCIALIEAMAAGLCCVVTARAALPETAHGFARLVPIEAADDPVLFTQPLDYGAFTRAALEVIHDRLVQPDIWEEKLHSQRAYFLRHYRWQDRVAPWVEFITSLGL